jgi:hypothetical protein
MSFEMDFDDDEAPPMLVDTGEAEDQHVEEPARARVPITIVTGRSQIHKIHSK